MKRVIRLMALASILLISALNIPVAAIAVGDQAQPVLIVEVSPESKNSASEEYIELYNPNAAPVEVTGWQLQYRSASHTPHDTGSWTTKSLLGCATTKASDCPTLSKVTIGGGEDIRLSSYEKQDGIEPLVSGMATTGGQVRLLQPQTDAAPQTVQDMIGYGTAAAYEGSAPAPAPRAGVSIVRSQTQVGGFVDTDNNAIDFILNPDDEFDDSTADPAITGMGGDPTGIDTQTYLDTEITEVLPDPASPQLDSADEFIELYNPYDEAIDLTGYALKTGTDWSHKYVIQDVVIDPHTYVALMSAQTHLSLTNTGSGVRLYDPAGNLLFEVPSYGKAQTGDSWVRDANGQWVWTTTPTPDSSNIISAPPAAATTTNKSTKTTTKTATKTTVKKAPSPAKAASAVKGTATSAQQAAQTPGRGGNANYLVLIAIGVLAAGYAAYEYRHEIWGIARKVWWAAAGRSAQKK